MSECANNQTAHIPTSEHGIILFYKYHPLSDDPSIVEVYRKALETFCTALNLKGRILVGCSKHRSEGLNGTLSGKRHDLDVFVKAFAEANVDASCCSNNEALEKFRLDCNKFYKAASCPVVEMKESEFKWSTLNGEDENDNVKTDELFPDLNVKIVRELIGTGGVLSSIPIGDLHKGYLTPKEWHERISQLRKDSSDKELDDTVLIDCRNTKECAIGNFVGAIDPQTTTFNQFPKWVDDHKHKLRNKKVLMYCTGGIRCEKASAYVRKAMGSSVKEVRHLRGGIHKYLEEFGNDGSGDESMWRGKNFVFDGRGAHGPAAGSSSVGIQNQTNDGDGVGSCRYCNAPYDSFDPHCVCTVCKEPILICKKCQQKPAQQQQDESPEKTHVRPQHHRREYHCDAHKHLEDCYFTNLDGFSVSELSWQLAKLDAMAREIAVGKKFKQRRKTLMKQRAKLQAHLEKIGGDTENNSNKNIELKCRNCGQVDCSGKCWGFHGLKRKRILEQDGKQQQLEKGNIIIPLNKKTDSSKNNHNAQLKERKEIQKRKQVDELIASGLVNGPGVDRDPNTGLRVPKPCVRVLETNTKGKWCGMPLLKVLQTEFPKSFHIEASSAETSELDIEIKLQTLLARGLVRVNGTPILSLDEANSYKLKNMDVVDRIVHWHEPPIHLPHERIGVQKIPIPKEYVSTDEGTATDNQIYVCNKPATVPVHPAGPYLSNTLTMLVEAQEGLPPKALIPCHRIDRVTSGMIICCVNPKVARLIQTTISNRSGVQKEYLAKVIGRFPSNDTDANNLPATDSLAKWKWAHDSYSETLYLQVDAPIQTVDPLNGIRKITPEGKASTSRFRFLEYDTESDTSIISCTPVTGRSHQLRVHLEYIGHSIVDDIQYGGKQGNTVIDPSAGLKRISDSLNEENSYGTTTLFTDEQAQAARELCPTCDKSKGASSAFSPAQLLQGGHAICLHAYRYTLALQRESSNAKDDNNSDVLRVFHVNLSVELPPWALHLRRTTSSE